MTDCASAAVVWRVAKVVGTGPGEIWFRAEVGCVSTESTVGSEAANSLRPACCGMTSRRHIGTRSSVRHGVFFEKNIVRTQLLWNPGLVLRFRSEHNPVVRKFLFFQVL